MTGSENFQLTAIDLLQDHCARLVNLLAEPKIESAEWRAEVRLLHNHIAEFKISALYKAA